MLALICAPLQAAPSIEKSRTELDALHKKMQALSEKLNASEAAHRDAADELKGSEKAISEANRKLRELTAQQQQNRRTLASLEQQRGALDESLKEQQRQLDAQLYQQYLHGHRSYLRLLLQQQDPNEIARRLHYYSYVARARTELIAQVRENLQQIATINSQTTATLEEIDALKQVQESEQQALQTQKAERSRVLKKLAGQIAAQRNTLDKLKRDEKRLTDLMERLAKIAREQAAKRKKAPAAAGKPSATSPAVARNDALPSSRYDGSNFAALKGKLRLPVRGEVTNRFGAARPDTGISWKGLFIRAEEGAEVKSVAKGSVVFADWLRGFGNLIIIDHGDGYMSLYGNNQALLKKLGDEVKGGDTIAAVGNTGGNASPGLYFELRLQSKPFDPLAWSMLR